MGKGSAGMPVESQAACGFPGGAPIPSSLRRQGPSDFAWPLFTCTPRPNAAAAGIKPLEARLRRRDGLVGMFGDALAACLCRQVPGEASGGRFCG